MVTIIGSVTSLWHRTSRLLSELFFTYASSSKSRWNDYLKFIGSRPELTALRRRSRDCWRSGRRRRRRCFGAKLLVHRGRPHLVSSWVSPGRLQSCNANGRTINNMKDGEEDTDTCGHRCIQEWCLFLWLTFISKKCSDRSLEVKLPTFWETNYYWIFFTCVKKQKKSIIARKSF